MITMHHVVWRTKQSCMSHHFFRLALFKVYWVSPNLAHSLHYPSIKKFKRLWYPDPSGGGWLINSSRTVHLVRCQPLSLYALNTDFFYHLCDKIPVNLCVSRPWLHGRKHRFGGTVHACQ